MVTIQPSPELVSSRSGVALQSFHELQSDKAQVGFDKLSPQAPQQLRAMVCSVLAYWESWSFDLARQQGLKCRNRSHSAQNFLGPVGHMRPIRGAR